MEAYRDISIYDANSYFILVGRTKSSSFYKILKIRKQSTSLEIQEVKRSFTEHELTSYLKGLFEGQIKPVLMHAEVILGVIKFLQGYYLFAVTKKSKSAVLRGKSLYKIECAKLLKLFPEKKTKDEKRYVDIFYTLDLALGFYFSYSYDLTQTLQENLVTSLQQSCTVERNRSRAKTFASSDEHPNIRLQEIYEWKTMYVWNHDMVSSLYGILTDKNWLVPMVHGYVGYHCVSILGKKYDIVLISRRSRFFAGTRYLKRGLSEDGKVANDVETEQIIIEKLPNGKITSYTQHRGSVPLFWCQDPNSMLPSPPIILNQNDFLLEGSIKHFADLFQRYGSPIVIINLLRVTDKNKENNLSLEYETCVQRLNEQISEEHRLQYNSFDIKNEIKKDKRAYVQKFYNIYKDIISKTSIFTAFVKNDKTECNLQIGVVRTNCVDCIDRTNEGQLLISHLALEAQLRSLGLAETLTLSKKSDIVQLFTMMFEEMGDVIALQYSGSIAHKSANSEKQKQSKLLVATQRHLANLMKDSKKQQAINLFLGIYKTDIYPIHLWDISDDFRLHNKIAINTRIHKKWWKHEIQRYYNRLGIRKEANDHSRYILHVKKPKHIVRTRIFHCDKNLLTEKNSLMISSLEKRVLSLCSDVIEIVIKVEGSEQPEEVKKLDEEYKKKYTVKSNIEVSREEIELFNSYAQLAEINTKDNFLLAIVQEELHSEIKEKTNDEFNEYLNYQIDTRKLLRELDEDEEESDDTKEIEREIIDIIIIDEYLDQYQPPSFLKCIHYKEFHA